MGINYSKKYPIGSGIWRTNRKFVLEELARLAEYKYGELDEDAIEYGIQNTDSEIPLYFEYSFIGSVELDLAISNESGAETMMILVSCPESHKKIVEHILSLATLYEIRPRN